MITPRLTANDKGNGISMDKVRPKPKDIVIQNNCLSSNRLLFLPSHRSVSPNILCIYLDRILYQTVISNCQPMF